MQPSQDLKVAASTAASRHPGLDPSSLLQDFPESATAGPTDVTDKITGAHDRQGIITDLQEAFWSALHRAGQHKHGSAAASARRLQQMAGQLGCLVVILQERLGAAFR